MATHERESTRPVDLGTADGRLDRAAVGWSRTPLHRCNLRGWGRNKCWEYWCVTTPTHLVAVTGGDVDYLDLSSGCFLEYGSREVMCTSLRPLTRGVRAPESLDGGAVSSAVSVRLDVRTEGGGTRLRLRLPHRAGPLTGVCWSRCHPATRP